MKLGDVANADAVRYGKPLDGIRVLAAEQMQALPVRHPAAGPPRCRGGEGRASG